MNKLALMMILLTFVVLAACDDTSAPLSSSELSPPVMVQQPVEPSATPSVAPTLHQSAEPSATPSVAPTLHQSAEPSATPSDEQIGSLKLSIEEKSERTYYTIGNDFKKVFNDVAFITPGNLGVYYYDQKAMTKYLYRIVDDYSVTIFDDFIMERLYADGDVLIADGFTYQNGEVTYQQLAMTADDFTIAELGNRETYEMGNGVTVYTQQDGNVYMVDSDGNDKQILDGLSEEEEPNWELWSSYNVLFLLDDSRFVYTLNGYEWFACWGVYDTATGENIEMLRDFFPFAVSGGKVYTHYSMIGEIPDDIRIYDAGTLDDITPLNLREFAANTNMYRYPYELALSPDGMHLAVLWTSQYDYNYSVVIYDTATGNVTEDIAVTYDEMPSGLSNIGFYDNSTLVAYSSSHAKYPYTIILIPLGGA